MFTTLATRALLAFGAIGLASAAEAADLDAPFSQYSEGESLPSPQYTFGTGWYLRGDLTASDDKDYNLRQQRIVFRTDPRFASFDSRKEWGYGAGGGVGYQFSPNVRADFTGDYLSDLDSSRTDPLSGLTQKASIRRWDGLVNTYFDFGTWAGLTPYIGAGVGFGMVRTNFGGTGFINGTNKNQYELAWAAMAGVAYHISPNLLLDVGYRYLDLGTYRIGDATRALTSQQVRAGLRYMIE